VQTRLLTTCVAVLTLVASASSQQSPAFTGNWTATTDPGPGGVAAAPSAILGARLGLKLDGQTLIVTRPLREEVFAVTFKLDGTPSSYRLPGRLCEGDAEFFETATLESGAVALTIIRRVPGGGGTPLELKARRVLKMVGDLLVVEGTLTQAGTTRAVATVYKRGDALPAPRPPIVARPAAATIAQAAWIGGVWIGVNGAVTSEERWTPPASGGMIGVGRTLRGETTLTGFEFLCIAEREGSLVYIAMPDARTPATYFMATSVTADSVTFENPGHDYPKLIRYTKKADGTLETTIAAEGGQRAQSVVLKRQ
jgi:Domain of unknown function (DUF6265)